MDPLYKDGQLAWIQATSSINVSDVGLFTVDGLTVGGHAVDRLAVDGHGFIKIYDEK